jgi:phospholipid/cholesterol/gamma-HCH transport system ATP-binding protein
MAVIQIQNFKKSFGSKLIHDGVNFDVLKGECLGLIGGSGAGKSVILRSLIGLEKADSGKILINSTDITNMNENQLIKIRKNVAYVFQNGALFDSMTVFDNLAFSLRAHTTLSHESIDQKISAQLDEFGLLHAKFLYPSELSGGMQKRVGLARAIMLDPDVILYDEPTAGLDPYNTLKIQELILRLKSKGVTSILVTHDMPTAINVCDRFVFLQNKVISENGTAQELLQKPNSLVNQFIKGQIV